MGRKSHRGIGLLTDRGDHSDHRDCLQAADNCRPSAVPCRLTERDTADDSLTHYQLRLLVSGGTDVSDQREVPTIRHHPHPHYVLTRHETAHCEYRRADLCHNP